MDRDEVVRLTAPRPWRRILGSVLGTTAVVGALVLLVIASGTPERRVDTPADADARAVSSML
jgi:hypothetical protein